MKRTKLLLWLSIALFAIAGCKVGEDDPFLSLSSRKARLSGDWQISSGTWYEEEYDAGKKSFLFPDIDLSKILTKELKGEKYTLTYNYQNGQLTMTESDGDSFTFDDFKYNIQFSEDGTFSLTQYYKYTYKISEINYTSVNEKTYEYSGKWYFMDGNKELDVKDKERVFMQVNKFHKKSTSTITYEGETSVFEDESTEQYEGTTNADNILIIGLKRLAKDEMIITYDSKEIDDDNDYYYEYGEITFTKNQ